MPYTCNNTDDGKEDYLAIRGHDCLISTVAGLDWQTTTCLIAHMRTHISHAVFLLNTFTFISVILPLLFNSFHFMSCSMAILSSSYSCGYYYDVGVHCCGGRVGYVVMAMQNVERCCSQNI